MFLVHSSEDNSEWQTIDSNATAQAARLFSSTKYGERVLGDKTNMRGDIPFSPSLLSSLAATASLDHSRGEGHTTEDSHSQPESASQRITRSPRASASTLVSGFVNSGLGSGTNLDLLTKHKKNATITPGSNIPDQSEHADDNYDASFDSHTFADTQNLTDSNMHSERLTSGDGNTLVDTLDSIASRPAGQKDSQDISGIEYYRNMAHGLHTQTLPGGEYTSITADYESSQHTTDSEYIEQSAAGDLNVKKTKEHDFTNRAHRHLFASTGIELSGSDMPSAVDERTYEVKQNSACSGEGTLEGSLVNRTQSTQAASFGQEIDSTLRNETTGSNTDLSSQLPINNNTFAIHSNVVESRINTSPAKRTFNETSRDSIDRHTDTSPPHVYSPEPSYQRVSDGVNKRGQSAVVEDRKQPLEIRREYHRSETHQPAIIDSNSQNLIGVSTTHPNADDLAESDAESFSSDVGTDSEPLGKRKGSKVLEQSIENRTAITDNADENQPYSTLNGGPQDSADLSSSKNVEIPADNESDDLTDRTSDSDLDHDNLQQSAVRDVEHPLEADGDSSIESMSSGTPPIFILQNNKNK